VKLGVTWREAFPLTSIRDEHGLAHLEDVWKAERKDRATNSFLRNDFRELMPDRRYFVAELNGTIISSMTCAPLNATSWYLQDPVRTPDAPRGALEGAMAFALDTLRDEGYLTASNGVLPFWPSGGGTATTHMGRVIRYAVSFFDRLYRFGRINQFRSKFTPDRVGDVYVVRSHRVVTPWALRGLIRLLTSAPSTTE
jgi:hypothetical protein